MKKGLICSTIILFLILSFTISVSANNPPEKPIIIGSTNARINKIYTYTFVVEDPDNDPIGLCFCSWGDEACYYSCGLFQSGKEININHIWKEIGTKTIKVCSVDCHGACSEFVTYDVKVSKIKLYDSLFFEFLEKFPIISFILKYF